MNNTDIKKIKIKYNHYKKIIKDKSILKIKNN